MTLTPDRKVIVWTILVFLAACALLVGVRAFVLSISYTQSLLSVVNPIYDNPVLVWNIIQDRGPALFSLLPLLFTVIYIMGRRAFPHVRPLHLLIGPLTTVFLFLVVLQLANIGVNTHVLWQRVGLKNETERLKELKKEYAFSVLVKDCLQRQGLLPRQGRAVYISEWDLTREPFMGFQRSLAYYFLPEIDIRGVYGNRPVEVLIIFPAKDPGAYVPPEFTVVCAPREYALVAVRRRP